MREVFMSDDTNWKDKFQDILNTCQEEFKRTTLIGKKMINASKTNTVLKESYEELGSILYKAILLNEHEWDNNQVHKIIDRIKNCEKDLENIEQEVQEIKKETNLDEIS